MRIEAITNTIISIDGVLQNELLNCNGFSIATAFIDQQAISMLEQSLSKNKAIKKARILIGIYGCFNKKADLETLFDLSKKYAVKIQVHISRNRNFHWKYYHFTENRKQSIYIGSANFTSGGMGSNGELLVKHSESMPEKDKGFGRLAKEFDKEFENSRSIKDFSIDEYKENRAKAKSGIKLPPKVNSFFTQNKIKHSSQTILSKKAVVIYINGEMKASAQKALINFNSSWQKLDFVSVGSEREMKNCIEIKRLIIIERAKRGQYTIYKAIYLQDLSFKSGDGNHFIAYKKISRSIKIGQIALDFLRNKREFNFKFEGQVKNLLATKVLGSQQLKKIETIFNFNKK